MSHPLLQYPFDCQTILAKRRSIRRQLIGAQPAASREVRIAVLGGSTTHDIIEVLELFLLDSGIRPVFYESAFGQFYNEAVFGSGDLERFDPEVVFIHSCNRNITDFPTLKDDQGAIKAKADDQIHRFERVWDSLYGKFKCQIIQNNFEMPAFRLLGNLDGNEIHGRTHFLQTLNSRFAEHGQRYEFLHIHDINYLSSYYGLEQWSDPSSWYMYKYCLKISAIPVFSFSLAKMIRSIFGKNRKAVVLDLDNTLWGGVVGDDGVGGIEIGQECAIGQAYQEFQAYILSLKDLGILLTVCSKNDSNNALAGLNHESGILRPSDFMVIRANWENKDANVKAIADELNIGSDSLVFIDDNPVERDIVLAQVPGIAVPVMQNVEEYIKIIDQSGFFEVTRLTADDLNRNAMYEANFARSRQEQTYDNYNDFLISLRMSATIARFDSLHIQRITQLTNKSNQFNLTTKRYTQGEMELMIQSPDHVSLYGRLTDKFGDNGLVSVVSGHEAQGVLHIDLWVMSCRVLKRGMEQAMMDALVMVASNKNIKALRGYYIRTEKNGMVRGFYGNMGFSLISGSGQESVWELDLAGYRRQNSVIAVLDHEGE